jgi:small conductance mechanosensitive channel
MVDISLIWLAVKVIVAVAGSLLIGEFLIRIIIPAAKRGGLSSGQVRIIRDWLRLISIILAIASVVRLTGLASEYATLTVSGIIAIALSLALQNALSNVISGILLLLDNALRLNDKISYSGITGEIVKIGMRNIWVKTAEGNLVIVSNNSIANGPLINYTAAERLQKV